MDSFPNPSCLLDCGGIITTVSGLASGRRIPKSGYSDPRSPQRLFLIGYNGNSFSNPDFGTLRLVMQVSGGFFHISGPCVGLVGHMEATEGPVRIHSSSIYVHWNAQRILEAGSARRRFK